MWNNKLITYRNKTLFFKDWVEAGIATVNDITVNGNIKPLEDLLELIGHKPTRFFEYGAIRTAIINYRNREQNNIGNLTPIALPTTPKLFRKYLVERDKTESKAVDTWRNRLGITINKNTWLAAWNCTKETRLRLLHFKILYSLYPTNKMLFKMGITDSINCSYCRNEIDTIEHFFFECNKVAIIWTYVESEIYARTGSRIKLKIEDALLGINNNNINRTTTNIANHLILISKMCIGIYKYSTPINIKSLLEREILLRMK